jgi:hypothetical protein
MPETETTLAEAIYEKGYVSFADEAIWRQHVAKMGNEQVAEFLRQLVAQIRPARHRSAPLRVLRMKGGTP